MFSLYTHASSPAADLLEGRRGTPGAAVHARTFLHRHTLDEMLLSGVPRHQSPELALRARQLTRMRRRRALADGLRRVMRTVDRRELRLSAVPPLAREVRAARPALRELELALRSSEEVEPAGVLLTHRLLTDGAGPLFLDNGNDALWRAVRRATVALCLRAPAHDETLLHD